MLSDDHIDREFVLDTISDNMHRAMEIRKAAAKAWMEHQDFEAVTRAARANTRTVDKIQIKNGDRVYVWRASKAGLDQEWWFKLQTMAGPCGSVCEAIYSRRPESKPGWSFGAELRKVLTRELLEDLESGKVRHYRDIQHEEPPGELEMDEEMTLYEPSFPADDNDQDIFRELGLGDPDEPAPDAEMNPPRLLENGEDPRAPELESTRPPSEASAVRVASDEPGTASASRRSSVRVDEATAGEFPFGPIREARTAPPMPYPMTE